MPWSTSKLSLIHLASSLLSTPGISKDALFGLGRFFQGKERGTLGNRLQKQFQTGQKLPSFFATVAGMRSPFNYQKK